MMIRAALVCLTGISLPWHRPRIQAHRAALEARDLDLRRLQYERDLLEHQLKASAAERENLRRQLRQASVVQRQHTAQLAAAGAAAAQQEQAVQQLVALHHQQSQQMQQMQSQIQIHGQQQHDQILDLQQLRQAAATPTAAAIALLSGAQMPPLMAPPFGQPEGAMGTGMGLLPRAATALPSMAPPGHPQGSAATGTGGIGAQPPATPPLPSQEAAGPSNSLALGGVSIGPGTPFGGLPGQMLLTEAQAEGSMAFPPGGGAMQTAVPHPDAQPPQLSVPPQQVPGADARAEPGGGRAALEPIVGGPGVGMAEGPSGVERPMRVSAGDTLGLPGTCGGDLGGCGQGYPTLPEGCRC